MASVGGGIEGMAGRFTFTAMVDPTCLQPSRHDASSLSRGSHGTQREVDLAQAVQEPAPDSSSSSPPAELNGDLRDRPGLMDVEG